MKYEEGEEQIKPPGETTFKKPRFIRVKDTNHFESLESYQREEFFVLWMFFGFSSNIPHGEVLLFFISIWKIGRTTKSRVIL